MYEREITPNENLRVDVMPAGEYMVFVSTNPAQLPYPYTDLTDTREYEFPLKLVPGCKMGGDETVTFDLIYERVRRSSGEFVFIIPPEIRKPIIRVIFKIIDLYIQS